MLDVNKITKGLEDKSQQLVETLGECGVEVLGRVEEDQKHISLSFDESSEVELFVRILIRKDETDSASFSSRVFGQDYANENNWEYESFVINNLIDCDNEDGDEYINITPLTIVVFPVDDYDEVLTRASKYRDGLAEPVDESDSEVGFCKGCFVVELEDLIKFNQFEIIDLETGVTTTGSGIESVSLKEGIVQISLAK